MIEMSDTAHEQLVKYFSDKEPSPIRVYLASGGCAGPRLSLALDEARDDDEVQDVRGFTVVMDKELFDQAKPVKIEMSYLGFSVSSSLVLEGAGSCGCSGGCSSGGSAGSGDGCGSGSCC